MDDELDPDMMDDEMPYMEDAEVEMVEASAAEIVQETLEYFMEAADVTAVYAEPVERGDTLIIPAAEIVAGMGFGVGSGSGSGPDSEEGGSGTGSGSGGGGGGKILSRPVAVIIASPDGVRVEPVVDVTKIALAMFTAAGFMLTMLFRMLGKRSN